MEVDCKLLQLSDCVMLRILCYLDASSLYNLSRTCLRFKNIIQDSSLWRYIDVRNQSVSADEWNYLCDKVNKKTTHLMLPGDTDRVKLISNEMLMKWFDFNNLVVLSLEYQRFNANSFNITNFPKTLIELSLRGTQIYNGRYFFVSHLDMPNLRVLILDECNWFGSEGFCYIVDSNIEILSLAKCRRLHFDITPYLCLARCRFRKLKLLDVRFSTIASEVLTTLNRHQLLSVLYCQSMRSYELDKGAPIFKNFKELSWDLTTDGIVCDSTFTSYATLVGNAVTEVPPNSVLYKDPYPECRCKNNKSLDVETSILTLPTDVADDYIKTYRHKIRLLCPNHKTAELEKSAKNLFSGFPIDSPDNDSDSSDSELYDTNSDCCVYGSRTKHPVIMLKFRDADNSGRVLQPQMIDISDWGISPIGNSTTNNSNHESSNNNNFNDQPSTSSSDQSNSRNSLKRPIANSLFEEESEAMKRRRLREPSLTHSIKNSLLFEQQRNNFHRIQAKRQWELILEAESAHKTRSALKRLSLRGYRHITDSTLTSIRNLNLSLLDVTYTNVTKSGIEQFLLYNPDCRVVHKDYCICQPLIP